MTTYCPDSYTCVCPRGLRGAHCEERVDPCQAQPCFGEAVCRTEGDTFKCACPPGFSGRTCQTSEPTSNC